MALIEFKDVQKEYHAKKTVPVTALKSINFSIQEKEFTSIVGPSGSGKSTILNLLGCLDVPTSGSIIIDGTDIHNLNTKHQALFRREKIGFIFQSYNLIPVLTAAENISFPLTLTNLTGTEIDIRVKDALNQVGLGELANRRPNELSGGQQQRVAIARALAKRPAIVLADEPTANLDSKTGKEILDIMRDLNRKLGVTFIFSTHDSMVMDYADRLITLHDGEIKSDIVKEGMGKNG